MEILETNLWKVILLPDQAYLGRSVVVLKRDCGNLSSLTTEEWADLQKVIIKLEKAFKETFKPTMFNWACLMNGAYQESPPKPQVHFHFIPRYRNKVEFAGIMFEDLEFANPYSLTRKQIVSEEVLEKIKDVIKF